MLTPRPRAAALAAAALLLMLPAGEARADARAAPVCDVRDPVPVALRQLNPGRYAEEPGAGRWRTWQVPIGETTVVPPPSFGTPQAALDLAEVQAAALTRTAADVETARRWGSGAAMSAWTGRLLELIQRHSTDPGTSPPRFSRQIALFQTAAYDALVSAWNAKYCYRRPRPSDLDPAIAPAVAQADAPSYPSEHAVVAGVASVVLADFFPSEAATLRDDAWTAALSRVTAGTNYRTDVTAGIALGRDVGRAALRARQDDGYDAVWDGTGRLTGPCNWEPTPPAYFQYPAEPHWGRVRPWLMRSGSELRPAPPPPCGSPEYTAAAYDLYRASLELTDRQKAIALYWAGGPGTVTPPGMNLRIALDETVRYGLSTMRQARVLAYEGAALADAAIAAWDAKFTYWWDRPVLTIRREWDPAWTSAIPTPPFPGYVSGHSTFSGASGALLSAFFPDDAVALRAMATDAAMSRFYGGIHVRYDNEVGLDVGAAIAELAVRRAATDGA